MRYLLAFFFLTFAPLILANDYNPPWASVGMGVLKPQYPRTAYQIEGRTPLFWRFFRGELGLLGDRLVSTYIYAGAGFEKRLFGSFFIYPHFAPGIYFQGKGKRLGYPLEFRSSVDFMYEICCQRVRIGASFFHISNANLGKHNPGVNGGIAYLSFALF